MISARLDARSTFMLLTGQSTTRRRGNDEGGKVTNTTACPIKQSRLTEETKIYHPLPTSLHFISVGDQRRAPHNMLVQEKLRRAKLVMSRGLLSTIDKDARNCAPSTRTTRRGCRSLQ